MWWNNFTNAQIDQALSGKGAAIHQVSLTLTHAQIVALGANLIGAPSPNHMITNVWSDVIVDVTAGAYGNVDGSSDMYLEYESSGRAASAATNNTVLEDDSAVNALPWAPAQIQSDAWNPLTDYASQGIALEIPSNLGPLADGHIDNTISITASFLVRDVITRRYLTIAESGWDPDTRTFNS